VCIFALINDIQTHWAERHHAGVFEVVHNYYYLLVVLNIIMCFGCDFVKTLKHQDIHAKLSEYHFTRSTLLYHAQLEFYQKVDLEAG
jgi:hypothetical protein